MTARLCLGLLAATIVVGSAAAAAGDPERRDIRPADQAWAKRATLRPADLPGFTAIRVGSKRGTDPLRCRGFQPDLSDLTITGEAVSPVFQNQATGATIYAGSEVYKSVHDEREAWRRTARREALRCVAGQFAKTSPSGLNVKVTRQLMRAPPRVGERAVSGRIVASVTIQGLTIPVWIDLLGVARGRADATLIVSAVRSAPSTALEGKLLAVLDRRLKH